MLGCGTIWKAWGASYGHGEGSVMVRLSLEPWATAGTLGSLQKLEEARGGSAQDPTGLLTP